MAGVVVQTLAASEPARDQGAERFDRLEPVGDGRWLAEQLGSTPISNSGF